MKNSVYLRAFKQQSLENLTSKRTTFVEIHDKEQKHV